MHVSWRFHFLTIGTIQGSHVYTVLKGVEHRTQLDTSEQPGYKMNLASIHLAEPSLSKMLNPPSSKSGLIKEREREKKYYPSMFCIN